MRRIRRPLPLLVALPVGAVGGLTLSAAFPEPGWWFLAIPGVVLMLWPLIGRNGWGSLLVGLVSALALWLPLIDWLTLYLGPVPWLGLVGVMTFWYVLSAWCMARVLNDGHLVWTGQGARIVFVPLVVAGLWTAREGIASVWPWGGFSWGRIAQSQADGMFAPTVSWVSTAGLTFLLVWVAASIVMLVRTPRVRWLWSIPLVALVVLALIPTFPTKSEGTLRIAAVQGNADAGLFSGHQPGDILNDHLAASQQLVGTHPDVVVWPENGNDVDPLRDEMSAGIMSDLSNRIGAPIVFGTITHPGDDTYFNSSIVWDGNRGPIAQYDKIHPVPFAEYMPARDFFHLLVPDLVDLVTRDYSFGTRPNVVTVADTPVGLSICFDITDDQQAYDMISQGAQVILAQTNNADFGHTDESLQQLAIARLRAIETGRSVVNVSTVGVSAIISPTGQTVQQLPRFEAGVMLDDVELRTGTTPAMALGRAIEVGASACGLIGLILVSAYRWRHRVRQRVTESSVT